ncbi:hypothetical protein ACXGQW_11165 [Wenyingzhuangia sp. IMCC45533]
MKDDILKYFELQKKLLHFEIVEKVGEVRTKIAYKLFVAFLFFIFFIFTGLGVSMYLNELFQSTYIGFLIIALFLLIVMLTTLLYKSKVIALMLRKFLDKNIPQ